MYKDNSNSDRDRDRDSDSDSDDEDEEKSKRDSKRSNDDEGQSGRNGWNECGIEERTWRRTRGYQAAAAAAAAAVRDMPVVKVWQRRQ